MKRNKQRENIEKAKQEICDYYCKYASIDSEMNQEELIEKCEKCPLNKLQEKKYG